MTWSAPPRGGERSGGDIAVRSGVRIAVIDTDSGFVRVLRKRLETIGWPHRILVSPVRVEALAAMRLDAIVVDLAVLGPQGWSYLDTVCARLPDLGVIVCTGRSSVAQRVRGLRLGIDHWVTKPCHAEELIARVEAVVRRRELARVRQESATSTRAGELEIRADQFQAYVDGVSLELSRREFELLELLARTQDQVIPREDIYQRVWGYAMAHGDRSVDVHVRKLRSKLERASREWRYIHTHIGVGYRFAAERLDQREPNDAASPSRGTALASG
jgi:DNA-binding response OmpR family regulator